MKVPSFDKRLEAAYRELAKALARLKEEQGIVGRRNARQAYYKAEVKLRRLVDRHFPTIKKKPKPRRRRRTPIERVRALRKDGYKEVASKEVLGRLATAGVRVERIKFDPPPGSSFQTKPGHELWAPGWAVTIASMAPKKLAIAKRSIKERKAILVELALDD